MANLVTSGEDITFNRTKFLIILISSRSKDTSKILEYRIESDNRSSDRVKVESNFNSKNRISYGELTRDVGDLLVVV